MLPLEWPSQSLSLNPIVTIWRDLKELVPATRPSRLCQLAELCREAWIKRRERLWKPTGDLWWLQSEATCFRGFIYFFFYIYRCPHYSKDGVYKLAMSVGIIRFAFLVWRVRNHSSINRHNSWLRFSIWIIVVLIILLLITHSKTHTEILHTSGVCLCLFVLVPWNKCFTLNIAFSLMFVRFK